MFKLSPLYFSMLLPIATVVGFIGNLLIIFRIIVQMEMLQSTMNAMILSLALADFGFLITANIQLSPVLIFDSVEWIFPNALCKFVVSLTELFFSGQILMYMAISLERFFVIVFPHFAAKHSTPRNGIIAIATVWIVATASAIPYYIFSKIDTSSNSSHAICILDTENSFVTTYIEILVYIRYVVPLLLSCIVYVPMFRKLAKKNKRQHISRRVRNKRKSAVAMMLTCIVAFIVCYTPQFIMVTFAINQSDYFWISFLLTFASCTVNPCCVLYFRWHEFWQKDKEEDNHHVELELFRQYCQTNVNQLKPITAFMLEHELETIEQTGFRSSMTISGSFVNLHIDAAEMLFIVRNCSEAQNAENEVVFLDELLDVYVGNPNNTKKKRHEESIKRIPDSEYSKSSARCVLTVAYGCDLRRPKTLILVTKSARDAQNWCDALRELAEVARRRINEGPLYYWRRHVAASSFKFTSSTPFRTVLIDMLPFATEEMLNRWNNLFLRMSLIKGNKPIMELLSDEDGLKMFYAIVLGRKNDLQFLQILKDADIREQCQLSVDMKSMNHPLSHYYINSSHNTYLRDRQVITSSSVSIYKQVLRAGCKCIELDCWNGEDGEPIIKHGNAVTSGVLFKDVIQAIKEEAFSTSMFPVILSFENHCTLEQQDTMAKHCEKILGKLLLKAPLKEYPLKAGVPLPTPFDLRCKILIKNKKLGTCKDGEVSPRLSALVNYAHAVSGFPELSESERADVHSVLHSLSESSASSLLNKDAPNFIKHNARQLSRIYSNAFRVDSSNYDPMIFWTAGCQLVALNLQTPGLPRQMNTTFFKRNCMSGYVLKPECMRRRNGSFDPTDDRLTRSDIGVEPTD